MGLLDRIKDRSKERLQRFLGEATGRKEPSPSTSAERTRPHDLLQEGEIVLHAVGESASQDDLARLRGTQQPFRQTWASLVAEPTNPYDANAVAVVIDDVRVGYLCREDAELLQHSVVRLTEEEGTPPRVRAAILGGGTYRLGVQLIFDPLQFGVAKTQLTMIDPRGFGPDSPRLELREARGQVKKARSALDRHYAYLALEDALYRLRDEPGNLDEFETVCERHHAAMDKLAPALVREFGKLPLLKHYKQMAIAKNKAKDHEAALSWCRRGIAVYESAPHESEHVEDLEKRIAKLEARLGKESSS